MCACVFMEVPYPDLRLFVLDAVKEEFAAASKPSQFLTDGVHTNGVKWQERAGLKALWEGGGVESVTMTPPTSLHFSPPPHHQLLAPFHTHHQKIL